MASISAPILKSNSKVKPAHSSLDEIIYIYGGIIRPNARREEVVAFLALQDCLLHGRPTIIGDNIMQTAPDIITTDRKTGIEVVCCDNANNFGKHQYMHGLVCKNFFPKEVEIRPGVLTKEEETEYFEAFNRNINRKLKKLNNGSYSYSEKTYLFVHSNMGTKSVDLDKIYECYQTLGNDYFQQFDNVFLYINNKLFELGEEQVHQAQNGVAQMEDELYDYFTQESATPTIDLFLQEQSITQ